MPLLKCHNSPHYRRFTLIAFILILMAISATRSFADPMDYTLTGDIEGTMTADFMSPPNTPPAVLSWSFTYVPTGGTWSSDTDDPPSKNEVIGLGGALDLEIKNVAGNALVLTFFAPQHSSKPFTYDGTHFPDRGEVAGAYQATVPEPTTMLLFASGLLGLAGYRWQQRRREGTQVG